MPASSPESWSMISILKPFDSAHFIYIRKSIAAQSHDSVPPAPAFTLNMALHLSASSLKSVLNSSASSHLAMPARSFLKCSSEAASSGPAMDITSLRSLNSLSSFMKGSMSDLSAFNFLNNSLERASSFQKPSLDDSSSREAIFSHFLPTSKITSEVPEFLL